MFVFVCVCGRALCYRGTLPYSRQTLEFKLHSFALQTHEAGGKKTNAKRKGQVMPLGDKEGGKQRLKTSLEWL